jgi:hypothetical protein
MSLTSAVPVPQLIDEHVAPDLPAKQVVHLVAGSRLFGQLLHEPVALEISVTTAVPPLQVLVQVGPVYPVTQLEQLVDGSQLPVHVHVPLVVAVPVTKAVPWPLHVLSQFEPV